MLIICKSILTLLQCKHTNWVLHCSEVNGASVKLWRNGYLALWNTVVCSDEKLWDIKLTSSFELVSWLIFFLEVEWNARMCSCACMHTHGSRSLILAPGLDHVCQSWVLLPPQLCVMGGSVLNHKSNHQHSFSMVIWKETYKKKKNILITTSHINGTRL